MNIDLPLINACLNGLSTVLLMSGFIAIKKKNEGAHKKLMIAAFITSGVFLACYLYYHFTAGHFKFTGEGTIRTIYFLILVPHILLAMVMLPMIIMTFLRAFKGQWEKHKKIAKITFPIWLYVSFTGVILYLYIYVWFPGNLKKEEKAPVNIEAISE